MINRLAHHADVISTGTPPPAQEPRPWPGPHRWLLIPNPGVVKLAALAAPLPSRYAEAGAPGMDARRAAEFLGVLKSRVGQLVGTGLLPYELGPCCDGGTGRLRFRCARQQGELNADA